MCRFVAYLSDELICLKNILEDPENSLIKQSISAQKGEHRVNADGFGIAWYNHEVDTLPGVFKSVRPAWNDQNLKHIAAKVRSNCFLGHVRSSTEGNVGISNCHPFTYGDYSLVHNGSIHGFKNIKKKIINTLDDDIFLNVNGQTDSEYFFAMILQRILKQGLSIKDAILDALAEIVTLQEKNDQQKLELNIVLTNGFELYATRFSFRTEPYSLYYSKLTAGLNPNSGILIASEPLNHYRSQNWHEVPENHMIIIDKDKQMKVEKIN